MDFSYPVTSYRSVFIIFRRCCLHTLRETFNRINIFLFAWLLHLIDHRPETPPTPWRGLWFDSIISFHFEPLFRQEIWIFPQPFLGDADVRVTRVILSSAAEINHTTSSGIKQTCRHCCVHSSPVPLRSLTAHVRHTLARHFVYRAMPEQESPSPRRRVGGVWWWRDTVI